MTSLSAPELYHTAQSELNPDDAALLPAALEAFPDGDELPQLLLAFASQSRATAVRLAKITLQERVKLIKEQNWRKRKDGELYSLITSVWKPAHEKFANTFKEMCRPGDHKGVTDYVNIREAAKSVGEGEIAVLPKIENDDDRSSMRSSNRTGPMKGKILLDVFGIQGGSRAHCIPNDKICCSTYGLAAQAVVGAPGLESSTHSIEALRALIYGTRGTDGNSTSHGIPGLKHLAYNRVALPTNHQEQFDNEGHWLVTPILTLKKMKEWTPETEYFALALCTSKDSYRALFRGADYADEDRRKYLQKCTQNDVRTATDLLRAVVKGVAELSGRDESNSVTPIKLIPDASVFHPNDLKKRSSAENEIRRKKESMTNRAIELKGVGTVAVPVFREGDHLVMKVKICEVEGLEAVTDPMLLAIKAAVTWSQQQQCKLLPACSIRVTESDSEDEDEDGDCANDGKRTSFDSQFEQTDGDRPEMLLRFLESQRKRATDTPRRVTPEKMGG